MFAFCVRYWYFAGVPALVVECADGRWGTYTCAADIAALLAHLNPAGVREQQLIDSLLTQRTSLLAAMDNETLQTWVFYFVLGFYLKERWGLIQFLNSAGNDSRVNARRKPKASDAPFMHYVNEWAQQ